MLEITKLLASKPITVEAKAMSSSNESTTNYNAPVSGIVGNSFTENAQVSGNRFHQTSNPSREESTDEHSSKTTILFLAANPDSTTRLRLDREFREIDESLRRSQHR